MVVEINPLVVVPFLLFVPACILFMRYPFAAVMVWLLFFPFVTRGATGIQIPIYVVLHRVIIPVTLWLVIVSFWAGIRKREVVRFGLAEFVMGISVLWAIGSIFLLGKQSDRLLIHFYDRLFIPYCMYWLIRLIAPTTEDLKRLLPVAFFTLMSQAVIGILSWFVPSTLPSQWSGGAGERVVGTFHNPAVYTSTLLFLALLILQSGTNSKSKWIRSLAVFTIGLAFFCVFISFSRGSWVGGILVLLGLIVVYRGKAIRLAAIGLIIGLILGSTLLNREVAFAYQRLMNEETAQDRLYTGARSISMIEQRPMFGWGYNNYDLYDAQFRTQIINSVVKESSNTSHNTYLTVMAEQGIPALVFYLFPAGWWLLLSLLVWRRMPRHGFLSVTMLSLLWLVLLDHFVVSNFMDMIRFNWFGTTIWWMVLALIANLVAPFAETQRGAPASIKSHNPMPGRLSP